MRLRGTMATHKKVMFLAAGSLLCLLAVPSGLAFANAANPCGTSATAGICPPNNAGGSGNEQVNSDGTVSITVNGFWSWATQDATSTDSCGGHFGVGWGIIWNDSKDPGFTVSGHGISEGVGSTGNSLNAADEAVAYNTSAPCGNNFVPDPKNSGKTIPSGPWGPATHVYQSLADVPALVCVNMYDLHEGPPKSSSDNNYIVDKNGDNSINTNDFNPSLGGGSCFNPAPQAGTLTGHIFKCDNGTTTTTEVDGGTIATTIAGTSSSKANPASFTGLPAGSYPASATAPQGWMFVHCPSSSTAYTIGSDASSASFVNPLNVPAGGSADADFYVVPLPPAPGTLVGNIFDCINGNPSTTREDGGTVTTTVNGAPSTQSSNPATFSSLTPGDYPVSATTPAGFEFVSCGTSTYTISNNTATYKNPLSVTSNNTSTADFYVQRIPGPSFVVTKAVSPSGSVPIHTDLTYTVTVENKGQSNGSPSKPLTDTLTASGGATCSIKSPAAVTEGTVSASPAGCPTTWTWDLTKVTFHPGDSATLTVVITALKPGALSNVAVLPNSNCKSGSDDPKCSTNTPVTLLLSKTEDGQSGPISVKIGDSITYEVTMNNNSDNPAHNVMVTDDMGGTAGFRVNDGSNGTTNSFTSTDPSVKVNGSNGTYNWTFTTIAAGDSASVQFTAVILAPGSTTSTINSSVSLTNTATVTDLPPVTVVANAPPPTGGVKAESTPSTGGFPDMNISVAGFMFLGGLGFILLGLLARKPRLGDLRTR
jgi:Domain of unknown function DUF11